jgi:hypothetical protein
MKSSFAYQTGALHRLTAMPLAIGVITISEPLNLHEWSSVPKPLPGFVLYIHRLWT